MPASLHLAANSSVHSSSLETKPSATTSFTLSKKIACGSSSTAGTSRLPSGSRTVWFTAGFSPLASAMASRAAASASFLIAL